MTQEEKQLLLKDICARLPYGVKIKCASEILTLNVNWLQMFQYHLDEIKPYLRPMESMTDEEKEEYHSQVDIDMERTSKRLQERFESGTFDPENQFTPQYCHIDWLNEHNFDYRGLIEKGLALEAPEGMYK